MALTSTLFACSTSNTAESQTSDTKNANPHRTVVMKVAGQTVDCGDKAKSQCLSVKTGREGKWRTFLRRIDGFTYEPGYEYLLEVKRTTDDWTVGRYETDYQLLRVILKEKKYY